VETLTRYEYESGPMSASLRINANNEDLPRKRERVDFLKIGHDQAFKC